MRVWKQIIVLILAVIVPVLAVDIFANFYQLIFGQVESNSLASINAEPYLRGLLFGYYTVVGLVAAFYKTWYKSVLLVFIIPASVIGIYIIIHSIYLGLSLLSGLLLGYIGGTLFKRILFIVRNYMIREVQRSEKRK